MAFLMKHRKPELIALAGDLGVELDAADNKVTIGKKITESPDFSEEACKNLLDAIIEEFREEKEREQQALREEKEREQQALREEREQQALREEREQQALREDKEREFELEKLRIANASETLSTVSTRSDTNKSKGSLKHLMQKYDSETSDMSLYLTLFERQARTADINEREWVSQLMALLPIELNELIIEEPEEKSRDYTHIKKVLLDRFKMKPETLRVKFTQHQRKPGALWKELVFQLRNYLKGWLDGVKVTDFKGLQDLMITDQVKRRVPPEVKEHFLDDWGKIVDPSILAEKLDEYESVRSVPRRSGFPRNFEKKGNEKPRPQSPKKESKEKLDGRSAAEPPLFKNPAPKGNWRNHESFDRRKALACYNCNSTDHLRPNCPELKKESSVEQINHLGKLGASESLFAPYISTALVNSKEMKILRDSGSAVDLVSVNHIKTSALIGETVWIQQPLDTKLIRLPLAEVELENPEFGKIVTKAAVIDANLDRGFYLLGNGSAELIEQQKRALKINGGINRNPTQEPAALTHREENSPDPQNCIVKVADIGSNSVVPRAQTGVENAPEKQSESEAPIVSDKTENSVASLGVEKPQPESDPHLKVSEETVREIETPIKLINADPVCFKELNEQKGGKREELKRENHKLTPQGPISGNSEKKGELAFHCPVRTKAGFKGGNAVDSVAKVKTRLACKSNLRRGERRRNEIENQKRTVWKRDTGNLYSRGEPKFRKKKRRIKGRGINGSPLHERSGERDLDKLTLANPPGENNLSKGEANFSRQVDDSGGQSPTETLLKARVKDPTATVKAGIKIQLSSRDEVEPERTLLRPPG